MECIFCIQTLLFSASICADVSRYASVLRARCLAVWSALCWFLSIGKERSSDQRPLWLSPTHARYHHHYQRVATLDCCLGCRLGSSLMLRHEGAVRDSQPGGLPRSQRKPPHSFCSLLTCTKSTPAYRQQDIQGHDRLSTALRDLTPLAHRQTSQSGSQPARKPGTQAARQDGQDGPGSLTFIQYAVSNQS